MKNIFLFAITLFYLNVCAAQETIDKKNRLTDSVLERFWVLKTDKTIKEGPYTALFKRKITIVKGNYANNKKVGVWHFYKPNGLLVQTYDYDKKALVFESEVDTMADFHYMIDVKLQPTDTVSRPVKIGGIYYGFIPYLNAFQLPFDTMGINTDYFNAYIELLISPLGQLAGYKVHLLSALYNYNQVFSLDVHLFSDEDRQFYPVTLNGEPIISRIIIQCYVTADGRLDFN